MATRDNRESQSNRNHNQNSANSSSEDIRNSYAGSGRVSSPDSTSGNMAGSSTDSGGANAELVTREDSQKGRGYDGAAGENRDRDYNADSGHRFGVPSENLNRDYSQNQGGSQYSQGQFDKWDQQANQQQQQRSHWDRSYDSRKRHGMQGNRNNPDWENSRGGNQGSQGGYSYGQDAERYQGQYANQGRQPAQGYARSGEVYHAGGAYNQGSMSNQEQYGRFGQSSANEDYRNRQRQEEGNRGYGGGHAYGAGSYAGELNRDYGGRGYDAGYDDTSGYNRYREMGGYDRSHNLNADMDRGSDSRRDYSSANRGSGYVENRFGRDRYYGSSSNYGDYGNRNRGGGYDRDQGFNRGGDFQRDSNRGNQSSGGYERNQGYGRDNSNQGGGSHNYGSFNWGRNQGDTDYERQYGSRSGSEQDRGRDFYRNSYEQMRNHYGSADSERQGGNWNSGYGASQSNYSGSGTYGVGNAGYRRENRDYNKEQGRDYERSRNRREDEEHGLVDKAAERVRSWFGGSGHDENRRA